MVVGSTARLKSFILMVVALLATITTFKTQCVNAQGVSTLDSRTDTSIARAQSNPNIHEATNESADVTTVDETKPTGTRNLEAITESLSDVAALFQTQFETRFSKLLRAPYAHGKAARVPWPGDYWALAKGGINHQWDPTQSSPAAKYALAYGLDLAALTNAVFLSSGVFNLDPTAKRTQCLTNLECGEDVCVTYKGIGYCVATWEGLCHAWAPAAILELEPQCAVTLNGVRFEPLDIKALLTHSYLDSRTQALHGRGILGSRYPGLDTSQDKFGRYNQIGLRDVNPGTFHIILANIMGRLGSSFVIDRTTGSEVWNQPLRDYSVLQWKLYTIAEGSSTFFFRTNQYPFNPMAAKLAYVQTQVRWIVESANNGPLVPSVTVADSFTDFQNYEYVLELDANDNIIGGEWLFESKKDHPDFLWFVGVKPLPASVVGGVTYGNVATLLKASLNCTPSAASTTVKALAATTMAATSMNATGAFNETNGNLTLTPQPTPASEVGVLLASTATATMASGSSLPETAASKGNTIALFVTAGFVVFVVPSVLFFLSKKKPEKFESEDLNDEFYGIVNDPDRLAV